MELAPENYLGAGGAWRRRLDAIRARYPVLTHGLSLSLGGLDPLDLPHLDAIGRFVAEVGSPWHSDHLCWSSAEGRHLHELLPLPLTPARARHTAARVREVMARIDRPFAVENVSAYARLPEDTLEEPEFVRAVIEESGAKLLLDVNNVFVNAQNFGGDPRAALAALPLEATVQIHVAGFTRESPTRVIDTHGRPVDEGVFELLRRALERPGPVPVLLERDHDLPPLAELLAELDRVREIQREVFG